MNYEILDNHQQLSIIEERLRSVETEHFHITQMLAAGNTNTDPANGPVIGPMQDPDFDPQARLEELAREHTTLCQKRNDIKARIESEEKQRAAAEREDEPGRDESAVE